MSLHHRSVLTVLILAGGVAGQESGAAHPDRPGPWRLVVAAARASGDEERAREAQAQLERLASGSR